MRFDYVLVYDFTTPVKGVIGHRCKTELFDRLMGFFWRPNRVSNIVGDKIKERLEE